MKRGEAMVFCGESEKFGGPVISFFTSADRNKTSNFFPLMKNSLFPNKNLLPYSKISPLTGFNASKHQMLSM